MTGVESRAKAAQLYDQSLACLDAIYESILALPPGNVERYRRFRISERAFARAFRRSRLMARWKDQNDLLAG